MRCQCCNRILHTSEIKHNKFLKRWDYCGSCKDASRHLFDDDYTYEPYEYPMPRVPLY